MIRDLSDPSRAAFRTEPGLMPNNTTASVIVTSSVLTLSIGASQSGSRLCFSYYRMRYFRTAGKRERQLDPIGQHPQSYPSHPALYNSSASASVTMYAPPSCRCSHALLSLLLIGFMHTIHG